MEDINRQLKLINNEDIVWIIYFFIVLFALFTNHLEKQCLFSKDMQKQKLARKINTCIFIVAFFIYLYFTYVSYNNLELTKYKNNNKEKRVAFERLIVNFLFLAAGALSIYADYDNNNNDNIDLAIF